MRVESPPRAGEGGSRQGLWSLQSPVPAPSSLSGLGMGRRSQERRGKTNKEFQEVGGPVVPHSSNRIPQLSTGRATILY